MIHSAYIAFFDAYVENVHHTEIKVSPGTRLKIPMDLANLSIFFHIIRIDWSM